MTTTEARSQIAFEELGLGSALSRYKLRVPANQREYSWEIEPHVTKLLQDFARAVINEGPYFLGTIVTIPRGEGELEVVDGQQRLATTALLLAAIRDYLGERGENELAESVDTEFLWTFDRGRRERIPRLTLNVDDNELFERIVTGGDPVQPSRSSHERLVEARDEARKHVERLVAPLDEREHADLLNRWISFIQYRAVVVLLRVPAEHDAYRMFETLNDRGLRTSQADLVKNFLFGQAGSRIGEVQARWSLMRGALESSSDDDDITITFLRHALIVQQGPLREDDVYDTAQAMIRSEATAVSFAGSLETLANAYVSTFNTEHERWNPYPASVRRSIEVFNLFNIRPLRPLILAVAAKMDQNEAARAFSFLVSLGVRLIVASSTRSGSVEIPLADAAKAVYDGQIATAHDLKAFLAALTPSDSVFRNAFAIARVSNARVARYYLRSLESAAQNEAEPWFIPQNDTAVINLEHVLPRKPEGNWPQFSDDDVKRLTTRLGNQALMLASQNRDIRSGNFATKKPVFAGSPYILTSEIAAVDDWSEQAIDDRQQRLSVLAIQAWPTT
jgi:hypothetical protein